MYRSVITNTSKEMSCFSDFPYPEDFPNYLHHSLVMEYFRMYARHFDLLRHIRFKVSSDLEHRWGEELSVAADSRASPRWDRTMSSAVLPGPPAFCILNATFLAPCF